MPDAAAAISAAPGRETDWRFLLPSPRGGSFEHLVLLGGSSALANTVVDLGIARRVSRVIDSAGAADALVVLAGAREPIHAAVCSLRHDGVLYWEVDRRSARQFPFTPARAMRRVRTLGLAPTGAYWVKPGFPDREMYLPIGAAAAFRWYLNTLYRSTSAARRVLKVGLRVLATSSRALATVAPCFAVTATRGTPRRASVVEAARDDHARSPVPVDPVFLAHGTAEWNRMAVLLFEPNAAAPTLAIKCPRRAVFNQQVEWEHAVVRDVGASLPGTLRGSLPRSSLFRWNDLSVCAQSCVPGAALSSRTGRPLPGLLDDLHAAAGWLCAFHRVTTLETVPAHQWLRQRLVAGLCTEYESRFGLTDAERHLFAMVGRRLDATDSGTLPIVWQHADFGPWNVYRAGTHLSVIDWEVARRGPALVDLLYFATEWSIAAAALETREERDAHFAALFCNPAAASPVSRAIHREVEAYGVGLRIASSLVPFLLVYAFLEQVLDRARRFSALPFVDAAEHAGNRYVRFLRVLAQHAGTLFPEELPHAA